MPNPNTRIKTVAQLNKLLRENISNGMASIGEQAVEKAKRKVVKWYGSYSPKSYHRVGSSHIADALTSELYGSNNLSVKIFYDTHKAKIGRGSASSKATTWQLRVNRADSADGGYRKGQVFGAYDLVRFVETGENGGLNPRIKGADALAEAQEWIHSHAIQELANRFKSAGAGSVSVKISK